MSYQHIDKWSPDADRDARSAGAAWKTPSSISGFSGPSSAPIDKVSPLRRLENLDEKARDIASRIQNKIRTANDVMFGEKPPQPSGMLRPATGPGWFNDRIAVREGLIEILVDMEADVDSLIREIQP